MEVLHWMPDAVAGRKSARGCRFSGVRWWLPQGSHPV